MTELASAFRALHHGRPPGDPLVLPGPWDAASARVFEDAGFPALATPSASVAASLGYDDGRTPAAEMFAARITFGPQLQRGATDAVRGLGDRLLGR